jgi:two-component system, OmpR family, sensor histidine kinase MtrB
MLKYLRLGLGLRSRIALSFGLGGLMVSALLSLTAYSVTRTTSLEQRSEAVESQFFKNAGFVQAASLTEGASYGDILRDLPQLAGASPIANIPGNANPWVAPRLAPEDLPTELVERVAQGDGAYSMRYSRNGSRTLAIGVRVSQTNVSYFEVVTLSEIESSLSSLRTTLAAASLGTTLIAAMLGVWAAGRALRPLASVGDAAQSIAAGDLDTRIEGKGDPDLDTFVGSFNDMASALETRIERDTRFASDVSHELRSPLMTLRASIDVLDARRSELSERSAAALNLLSDDVTRFQRLVEDLLEISRSDAGSIDASFQPIDLRELVTRVLSSTGHADVEVNVRKGAGDCVLMGDKRRLVQVVSNLIENADKYATGPTAVGLSGNESTLRLMIDDNGPGVPLDERGLIFDRFARGAMARRRGSGSGAGLGLALVAEHVRLHHGRVWVEDVPELAGSRFVVELPRGSQA